MTQAMLWLGSVNLMFFSLLKLRLPVMGSLIGAIIFCSQLTILSVTYEVLSESLTIFVCCWYLFIVSGIRNLAQLRQSAGGLLILATILALLKPLFEPFFFVSLAGVIYLLVRHPNKKLACWFCLSLFLISIQFFIMVKYADEFSLSEIGAVTFQRYLLSQTLSRFMGIDLESARSEVLSWKIQETIQFVVSHFAVFISGYFQNIHSNISTFPNETSAIGSPAFELSFMIWWNKFDWLAQLTLPCILFFSRKKLKEAKAGLLIILLAIPLYNVLLVTGISFGQGERLILPAIPLVIGVYAILLKIWLPDKHL
jgi:hypothetical protein